ncbi:MAG: hypothetical protein OXQ84_18855 [bacterium]|nr:hypothetical protein [bacterium]
MTLLSDHRAEKLRRELLVVVEAVDPEARVRKLDVTTTRNSHDDG